jgi:hypothetical protein
VKVIGVGILRPNAAPAEEVVCAPPSVQGRWGIEHGALGRLVGRAQSTNRGRGQLCPLCVLVEGIQDCSRAPRINDVALLVLGLPRRATRSRIRASSVSDLEPYFFSLGVPRKRSESKMKFWPEGSIMTWILSLSF